MTDLNLQVFHKFTAKDKDLNEIVEYQVQTLPKSLYEDALNLMEKAFIPYETLQLCKKTESQPENVENIRKLWLKTFQEGNSIACFKSGDDKELVGVNVLSVCTKGEDHIEDDKPEVAPSDIMKLYLWFEKQFDVYEAFDVDKYLAAYGLCVDLPYRGRGIATEMLKARIPILKHLNLTLTSTTFTGIASQKAAKKAGFEDAYTISYEELGKKFTNFDFTKTESKFFKKMILKVENYE